MNGSSTSSKLSAGKDFVSLARDGSILVFVLLLLIFPGTFNSVLVKAGFEEGSLVGLKWKRNLVASDEALQAANRTITDLQKKNDELLKALADANKKPDDPGLGDRIRNLEADNQRLNDQTQRVQSTVTQSIQSNAPFVQKALSAQGSQNRASFSVGLQTVGIPDDQRQKLNEKLSAEGYGLDPITYSYDASARPSWFARNNTVFYYSPNSVRAAQELAQLMTAETGQQFAVQPGAGLGVDPAKRDVTFFIHWLKG